MKIRARRLLKIRARHYFLLPITALLSAHGPEDMNYEPEDMNNEEIERAAKLSVSQVRAIGILLRKCVRT
jgi:hypothetical protein